VSEVVIDDATFDRGTWIELSLMSANRDERPGRTAQSGAAVCLAACRAAGGLTLDNTVLEITIVIVVLRGLMRLDDEEAL
jgi:hypothetical protein